MKRIYILIFIIEAFVPSAFAQFHFEFESFQKDSTELKARRQLLTDQDGNPAALLKIQIPMLRDVTISSPLKFGKENYMASEYSVYLGEGSKRVTIKHPDFEPFEYKFDSPLEGKMAYKLVLKVPNDYISLGQLSVRFNTNVLDASLKIDGKEYHTDNGEFYLKLKKGEYSYALSTSKQGYNQLEGTLSITDSDVKELGRIDRYLELQSDKKSNLHISSVDNSTIKIDGKELKSTKKAVSLPLGRHNVEVNLSGYSKTYTVDLFNDNEYLDADMRIPLTIISPSIAEFSVTPLDNALKPTLNKFKAGQTVRLLGRYKLSAKAKGYEIKEFEVTATPEGADEGLVMAIPMTSFAHNIYTGTGKNRQDVRKALKEYRKQIDRGDELAMWEYGNIMLESGQTSIGRTQIQRAADKNLPQAAIYTATNIVNGDYNEMRKYLDIALKGGEKSAHQILGDLLLMSNPNNYEKAFNEYSRYNSPYSRIKRAQIVLEHSAFKGIDHSEIVELLESIDKSDSNYGIAQSLLGEMAYKGYGMNYNLDRAIGYWNNARPENLSQRALLIMSVKNINESKLKQYSKYINLSELNQDFVVYGGIGLVQFFVRAGQIFDKQDVNEAFRLLNKAYDLGDRSLTTVSYLGKYYKDGTGIRKDAKKAKELLKIAVDNYKDVRAMRWLGNIYENEKDYTTAEQYYRQAVELDDPLAKGYYATLLYNKGKQNYPQAVKFWTEAGEAGHRQSIKNLITYYEKVARNPSKVVYWRNKLYISHL